MGFTHVIDKLIEYISLNSNNHYGKLLSLVTIGLLAKHQT